MRWARAVGAAVPLALVPLAVGCIPPSASDDVRVAPFAQPPVGTPAVAVALPLDTSEGEVAAREEADPALVLVVLDGVRWQEVFDGVDPDLTATARLGPAPAMALMPHLYGAIATRGAALGGPERGPAMVATGPNYVSLPGYLEILSGRGPQPCQSNQCIPDHVRTIADEVRARSADPADVAVFSSWDRIARAASAEPGAFVLSSGRSRLSHAEVIAEDDSARSWEELGARARAFPGEGDFRPDRFTAALALRYLEAKRPHFLFLGLGEPDEYAHRGDYAGYLSSLRAADETLGQLFATLDRMGTRGASTTVFVSTDHGRAHNFRFHGRAFPESGRVWLVAAGAGVRARGILQAARPHRLADLAPTMRRLLGLPADESLSSGAPIEELLTPPDGEYLAQQ
jgi:hypothetical protein